MRMLWSFSLCLLAACAWAAPVPEVAGPTFIDLKPHLNMPLNENRSTRFEGNDLAKLPTGKQTLGGVQFHILDGTVQLGSSRVEKRPDSVENIKVGKAGKKLHILHATQFYLDKPIVIGKYLVHYEDKTKAEIDIIYGVDVVDWWGYSEKPAPTKGKIAWESENEASKQFEAKIRLYLTTWENPHPNKRIATIDFVGTKERESAAPFCVALTLE